MQMLFGNIFDYKNSLLDIWISKFSFDFLQLKNWGCYMVQSVFYHPVSLDEKLLFLTSR